RYEGRWYRSPTAGLPVQGGEPRANRCSLTPLPGEGREARPCSCADSLPIAVTAGYASVLAGYPTPDGRRVGGVRVRVGPPLRYPDQAGLHQLQPAEERGDLRAGAELQLHRHQLVEPVRHVLDADDVDIAGRVGDGQIAAGR